MVSGDQRDGGIRDGAWVAEATDLVDLSKWPTGTRLILRKERPHTGAQLSFTDSDGHRITGFLTDTADAVIPGQLAGLELRHRCFFGDYYRDLYWRGTAGGTRVSGVLFGQNLNPWSVATTLPRMWVNPWASRPIPQADPFATFTANDDGEIVASAGTRTAHKVFSLPEGWPNNN